MTELEAWSGARRRLGVGIALSGALALAALVLCPLAGSSALSPSSLFASPADDLDAYVLWRLRVPRVLLAALAGAVLSTSGASFQAVLRNPLATPYTLGVASGASLGAASAIYLGWSGALPAGLGLTLAAFAGGCLSVLVVWLLSRTRHGLPGNTLVLAGVTLSFFLGALVLFLQFMANPMQLIRMVRWSIGGLESSGYAPVLRVLPFALAAIAVIWMHAADLNLLAAGDELARSRGVDADRSRLVVFLAASMATGVLVAETGPIGFVGLIVPHSVRLLVGPDHRVLVSCSALAGAAFLCVCDTVARTAASGIELPVGVLTALIGGPFFLVVLVRRRGLAGVD